jgi:nitrous oxidase accessory protein
MIPTYQGNIPNQRPLLCPSLCPSLRGIYDALSRFPITSHAEAIPQVCHCLDQQALLLTNCIKSIQTESSILKPMGLLRHLRGFVNDQFFEVARNDDTYCETPKKNQRLNRPTSLLLLIILMLAFHPSAANKIIVGKNEKFTTIKQAIAKANPNDTIIVKPGLYREGNIILEKPLTLIGEGLPTLDGENKFEILTIHANEASIIGFKFVNTGVASMTDIAGIKIIESEEIKILNNEFQNTFFGIHISNSFCILIEGNTLTSTVETENQIGNGIHLWKCEQVIINNNQVTGHRDGIYFEFVTHSLVSNNRSEGNIRYGLHFMFSHNDEYRGNSFINNGAGVAVMYTINVKMIDNHFEQNWGSSSYGLLLKDIRDSEVKNNSFIKNSIGIYMEGSSRINFSENIFNQNGWAIKLQASCDDNVFTKNNFTANTFDISTNGTLVLNTINNNYWDKYEGYDLKKDGTGDVPHRPVNLFASIVERIPPAMMLWRSFLVTLMDKAEKVVPAITPENLKDDFPNMKPYDIIQAGK